MSAECPQCAGCGRIANDSDGTPWKYWAELPLQSAVAVVAGIVRPLPCPRCNGTGIVGGIDQDADIPMPTFVGPL